MSSAPRPHTSPFTSSPPNGIARPVLEGHGHDVGVAHQAEGGGCRIGSLDAGDEAGAARRPVGLVHLDVETAALQVGAQHVARPHFLAGAHRAVVHALVSDQLLQQLHGLPGQRVVHGVTILPALSRAAPQYQACGRLSPGEQPACVLRGVRCISAFSSLAPATTPLAGDTRGPRPATMTFRSSRRSPVRPSAASSISCSSLTDWSWIPEITHRFCAASSRRRSSRR